MEYQIEEKVFLVTGAAGGIGAALVKAFLEAGAKHVAVLDVAGDAGLAYENELNQQYGDGKAKFYKCDVTNEEQLYKVFDDIKQNNNYVDVVINNAGIMNDNIKAFRKMIDINVSAVVAGTLKAIDMMRKDKGGRGGTVINISSVAALEQLISLPIYSATKSAVLQFTNCIGNEQNFKCTGVRCITMCFGATDTDLFDRSKYHFTGCDEQMTNNLIELFDNIDKQTRQSAADCTLEVFKKGASGSTWLSSKNKKVANITQDIQDGYAIFSKKFMNIA